MAVSWLNHALGKEYTNCDLPLLRRIGQSRLTVIDQMLDKRINCPMTSSCGRLFDAVAAILDLGDSVSYEAQAAVMLESIVNREADDHYEPEESVKDRSTLDLGWLVRAIIGDCMRNIDKSDISGKFHRTLARCFADEAKRIAYEQEIHTVVLSGGVFQNKYFSEMILKELEETDLRVLNHRRVPCNDGGLALGQAVIAAAQIRYSNQEMT